MANERTMLSWARTGINMIGVGILLHVVAGALHAIPGGSSSGNLLLSRSRPDELALFGLGLVVFGAVVEFAAVIRFIWYRAAIGRGSFTSSTPVYLLMVLGLLFLGVAFIGYVVIT